MYVVDCIKCGEPYRKMSAKEKQGHCYKCQATTRTDGNNSRIVIEREKRAYLERLESIELSIEKMTDEQNMYLEALQNEMYVKIEERMQEVIDSINNQTGIDYSKEVKEINHNLNTRLATINSRVLKLSEELEDVKSKAGLKINTARKLATKRRLETLEQIEDIMSDSPTGLMVGQIKSLLDEKGGYRYSEGTITTILQEGIEQERFVKMKIRNANYYSMRN
tara:strand:- start:607 stop:1272 length:666 start_codon:yes stop_codon:yes gene_type:complete